MDLGVRSRVVAQPDLARGQPGPANGLITVVFSVIPCFWTTAIFKIISDTVAARS